MAWIVHFHDDFDAEFDRFDLEVREHIMASVNLLKQFGPALTRPHVDTLNGSKFANMKELRFKTGSGVWRVLFAFDSERQAIVLVGANKQGQSEPRFYKSLIALADRRFGSWIEQLKETLG